jgi:hypothetical protein
MAPSSTTFLAEQPPIPVVSKTAPSESPSPLKLSGALEAYESFDVTPVIGREFPAANVVDWLNAPNADELLRDLAITSTVKAISHHTLPPDIISLSMIISLLTPSSIPTGSGILPGPGQPHQ